MTFIKCYIRTFIGISMVNIIFINSAPLRGDNVRLDYLIKEIFHIPSTLTNNGASGVSKTAVFSPIERPLVSRVPRENVDKQQENICINGKCVPFYLCSNNTVISDGEGLLTIRFTDEDDIEPKYCEATEICCGLPETDTSTSFEPNELPECGHRNINVIESRISGGGFAQYTEFPWMIAVFQKIKQSKKYRYQCGGSLIHPSVVLTTAHCVAFLEPDIVKIRAGEWDTENVDEKWPHQDRDVREIAVHRQYNRQVLYNDIALMFLDSPVRFGQNIDSICLPPQNFQFGHGERCFVSGWGKDDYGKQGKFPRILKKVELPMVSRAICQSLLQKTILGRYFNLHRSFICAGGEEGKDACNGDGGSPLICEIPGIENRYYQAGIVAWGVGCKNSQIPGVYVNVAGFRLWIDKQFQLRNIDNKYYKAPQIIKL